MGSVGPRAAPGHGLASARHEGAAVDQDGRRDPRAACETEFNRIRATAFPRAYFEKDNDARTGSKGDCIFRDRDDAGAEIVSIRFEMDNESDRTATRNRTEDLLKDLDKDRTERACEYASRR